MARILRSTSHWGAFRMQVEEGRLVGVEPFEQDPHPTPLIQAWPEMVASPLRVAAPAVRRGWLDGDRGARRGEDDYVEVDWSEALDLVARELGRVRSHYGNQAIFGGSYGWSSAGRLHHARTLTHRFLNAIGGFTGQVTNYSYGAAMAFLPRVLGSAEPIGALLTSWDAICTNADVLLAFGGIPEKNWEVISGGFGRHLYPDHLRQLAESGVRILNISPFRRDFPDGYPAEWVAIRPNTDAALVMALTQILFAEGLEDAAAIDRLTVGFPAYVSYLNGESDDVVKDAVWAEGITGVPAKAIVALARSLAGKKVMLTAAWSLQRARHGEQIYWAIAALAAALGQIGQPGCGFAFGYGSINALGNPRYETPISGLSIGRNPIEIAIPVARVADLLLCPGESIRFNGSDITYPDIKLVYWAGGNPFHHHQDLNRLRKAFRRPETVIVQEPFWTSTARHADIVLPATTPIERNDIGGSSRDAFVLAMHRAIAPVGQARNDYDIFADLAERLQSREAFTEGRDETGWLHVMWERCRGMLAQRGIEAPAFERFWEDGFFRVPEPVETYTMYQRFRDDPEGVRLDTASGLIEIFSQPVADMDDPEQPGHPVWRDPEEWLGADLAKRYPLHLLTPQPPRRLHSQMEASSHSRAGQRQDREIVTLNPADAARRGIRDGDFVRIYNARGACLACAALDEGLLPGVARLPTGAGFDPQDNYFDASSNANVLTLDKGTSQLGQGCAAQSCLVEIERLDGPLPPLSIFTPPLLTPREAGSAGA